MFSEAGLDFGVFCGLSEVARRAAVGKLVDANAFCGSRFLGWRHLRGFEEKFCVWKLSSCEIARCLPVWIVGFGLFLIALKE